MTLFVDFNMVREDGRYPALLPSESPPPRVGEEVVVSDGEGTACRALVSEVLPDGRIAMVTPVEGTWDRDSHVQIPAR